LAACESPADLPRQLFVRSSDALVAGCPWLIGRVGHSDGAHRLEMVMTDVTHTIRRGGLTAQGARRRAVLAEE
jgi:hypothetical protein